MTAERPRPVVLVILDGWGINPRREGNAIALARTPTWDRLWASCPHTEIDASAHAVGLPEGQMGNSEVGHLNIGAGFVVYQDLTRIDHLIETGEFFTNPILLEAVQHAQGRGSDLHLMGLLGPGGVHSHEQHLYALLELCQRQGLARVFVHAFLDGRDTPPQSALGFMAALLERMRVLGVGEVATVSGRYYAMDRDNRWDRVERAYRALVYGEGEHAASPEEAISQSYRNGVTDEFVMPTVVWRNGGPVATVGAGDAAIFFNFRADRGRELTKAFVLESFDRFDRGARIPDLFFCSLTQYEEGLPVHIALPPSDVTCPLAKVISDQGLRQYHTAETEKYAHVTFFINGGAEQPFPGEERLLVPSPRVATYDLQPEMSADAVTDRLVERIEAGIDDFIVVNYANGDMVGHTGIMPAAMQAAETIDHCLQRVTAAAAARGGVVLITADHGNLEQMVDYASGEVLTAHTMNPVPFVIVPDGRPDLARATLRRGGVLADIAPTILDLMGLPRPAAMDHESLIVPTPP